MGDTTNAGNGTESDMKPETQPEAKFKYDFVELCGCKRHAIVHIITDADEKRTWRVNDFDGMDYLCQKMDDDSAQKFRDDVAKTHAKGWLEDLLAPEILHELRAKQQQKQQEQQRFAEDLLNRAKKLGDRDVLLRMSKLSNHTLTKSAVDAMRDGLNKAGIPELFVQEMAKRGILFVISVVVNADIDDLDLRNGRKIVNQIINPEDLIQNELSKEDAELDDDYKQLQSDIAEFEKNGGLF